MQNLVSHEHAKSTWPTMRVRVGEIKTVLVVETDLMLDENDKGYDRETLKAINDLVVQAAVDLD